MAQKIVKSVQSMVEAAKREIEEIKASDAVKLHGRDDVVLVDLRDPRERERDGKVPGTFNVTRGMLEFWIDPESPYYKEKFGENKKFVFFCAGGLRSAPQTSPPPPSAACTSAAPSATGRPPATSWPRPRSSPG